MIAGGAESHLAKLFFGGGKQCCNTFTRALPASGEKQKVKRGPSSPDRFARLFFVSEKKKKDRTEKKTSRFVCVCVTQHGFSAAGKSFAPSHARCVHQTRKRHSSDANTHHLAPTPLHSRRMHAKVEEGFMERREGGRRRRRREKLNISQEKEGRGGGGGGGGGGFFSPHPSRGTDYISFPPFPYTRRITSCIKTPPHLTAKASPPYRRYRKFPFFKEIPPPIHSRGGGGGLEDN